MNVGDGLLRSLSTRTRVAVLADFNEERWPSMDLVAEMFTAQAPRVAGDESGAAAVQTVLLRPAFRRRFTARLADTGVRAYQAAWTIDRLVNRFVDYPRFLRMQQKRFDLFHLADHSYSQLLHELPPGRAVVTCHDLDTFRCLWEAGEGRRGRLFLAMTRRILSGMQKAAHVCCDSDATRDELLERRLMPRERISVVRLGVHPSFHSALEAEADETVNTMLSGKEANARVPDDRRSIDLLHVGSTIARKRIDVLLEVFARIKREIEPRARLLRVGGAFTAAQQGQIDRLGLEQGSICVLPFLSAAQLASVYRRAAIVLVPSDNEGFGLPVIEALASGTPVIASELPVLREVGGNAASYAAVASVDEWLRHVRELLTERERSPTLWEARRDRARQQGARFSWAETAAQMVRVYRAALAAMESEQCG